MEKLAKVFITLILTQIVCIGLIIANFVVINHKNNKIQELEYKILYIEDQRDLLSDAIRNYNDNQDNNEIINYVTYYLDIRKCNLDSLYSWTYCY